MPRFSILISVAIGLSACACSGPEPLWYGQAEPIAVSETSVDSFERIKADVLVPYCVFCHNPEKKKAGIDLTSLASILKNPKLLKWGRPDESLIYVTILEGSMPPQEFLSDELTAQVKRWIAEEPAL